VLILASASPRRRDLLTAAGFEFRVLPAHINEDPHADELPVIYVERLAREKAAAVFASLGSRKDVVVLGADTTVTIDDEILGKPNDAADAARMLRQLSGRTHQVITGVAIVSANGTESFAETTLVTMRELSDAEISAYIATGEPMDKAGAYAIQGGAAIFITQSDGDYDNVVGLPVTRVVASLRGVGVLPTKN